MTKYREKWMMVTDFNKNKKKNMMTDDDALDDEGYSRVQPGTTFVIMSG